MLNARNIGDIRAVPSRLTFIDGSEPHLSEVEVCPQAYLATGTGIRDVAGCAACGRRAFSRSRDVDILLDRVTIPSHMDLFRLYDLPTYLIATERFKQCVEDNGVVAIAFEEIGVSP
jgi:hypothetical protein